MRRVNGNPPAAITGVTHGRPKMQKGPAGSAEPSGESLKPTMRAACAVARRRDLPVRCPEVPGCPAQER